MLAQAIDVLPGEHFVGFHLVVLVGQMCLAGTVTRDAPDLLFKVQRADQLVFHVDVAERAAGKRIGLEWVFGHGAGRAAGLGFARPVGRFSLGFFPGCIHRRVRIRMLGRIEVFRAYPKTGSPLSACGERGWG